MIILHNVHDKASREFVAQHGGIEGVTALGWYNDAERNAWLAAGGTLAISAFPSMLLRHDTYTVDDVIIAPGWDVMRLPIGIDPLPTEGEPVAVGLYTHEGAFLFARQAHTRMQFEPYETPALFSVWRPAQDDMIWIANEAVQVSDLRIYGGVIYRAIQAHTTQTDWTPDVTPALWEAVEEPVVIPAWVQPTGAQDSYAIDDLVTHAGRVWKSLTNANSWEPFVVGTWRDQSNPPLWVQPSGSIGLWQVDDVVEHNGQTWRCTSANNSWEPGVFGWTLA